MRAGDEHNRVFERDVALVDERERKKERVSTLKERRLLETSERDGEKVCVSTPKERGLLETSERKRDGVFLRREGVLIDERERKRVRGKRAQMKKHGES